MRILPLLTLSLVLLNATACEKDIREVRRTQPGPVALGSATARNRSPGSPAAPAGSPTGVSGNPVTVGAAPRSPTDRR